MRICVNSEKMKQSIHYLPFSSSDDDFRKFERFQEFCMMKSFREIEKKNGGNRKWAMYYVSPMPASFFFLLLSEQKNNECNKP